jgi:hypothetical protein
MNRMTKDELVEKIEELLKTNINLNFLLRLKKEEVERLVACIIPVAINMFRLTSV